MSDLGYSSAEPAHRPEVVRAMLGTWRGALPIEDHYHRQLLTDAITLLGGEGGAA